MIYYRFYINNVLIPEPDNIGGWDKLLTNIKRDSSDLKGLLITQDVQLTFIGTQYQFFKDAYFNTGICAEYTTLIEQSYDDVNYSTLHRGIIKLRDVVLKDMLKGIATAKINDNSFYARINNNKSIETNLKGGWSKNGEPITGYSQYAVSLFKPIDNTNIGTRQMHSVFEAMKYLVSFMSDGEVGFESTFLETDLPMMLQQGYVMRTGIQPSPYWLISFQKLFANISKLRKIGWTIEYDSNEKPILRLEEDSYFYNQTKATDEDGNNIIFNDPEKIETSVNANELYGQVKLGSTPTFDSVTVTYPESIQFNGFKEESFYILGQCNIDNTLDLAKDMVISSNVIEAIVVNAEQPYDDNLILIVVENVNTGGLTADAKATNNQGTIPPAFYNMDLTNDKVANSFFFQNGLVAGFLNFTTNDFRAITTTQYLYTNASIPVIPQNPNPPLIIDPMVFQVEIDPGNNFNLGTNIYTAPITGFYTFNFNAIINIFGYNDANTYLQVGFGLNVNGTQTLFYNESLNNGSFQSVNNSKSLHLFVGDTVNIYIELLAFGIIFTAGVRGITINTNAVFSATATPSTGGEVASYDPQDIRNVFMRFKYPVESKLFDSIKTQLTKKYSVYSSVLGKTFDGWIESFSYPHKSQLAEIVLKTSVNTINPEVAAVQKYPAYRFEFDTLNVLDEIDDFGYNGGGNTVVVGSLLTQTVNEIITDISVAFAGEPITFNEIVIERQHIGGGLFHYVLIIVNPDTDFVTITVGGASSAPTFYYY